MSGSALEDTVGICRFRSERLLFQPQLSFPYYCSRRGVIRDIGLCDGGCRAEYGWDVSLEKTIQACGCCDHLNCGRSEVSNRLML